MLTDIEQEFYKVFEIQPATVKEYGATYFWNTIEIDGKRYTPIDDRKLLEMICIVFNTFQSFEINRIYTVETFKDKILSLLILAKDDVYNQIQQLFKGDNQ